MSYPINPNSIIPMYKQLSNILNEQISSGALKPGDRLPSESELIETFGVSRITVRVALSELVEEGLLVRSRGKGTFVNFPKSNYPANDTVGFSHSCRMEGKIPATKVLNIELVYPTNKHMEFFWVNDTDKIICTRRLRFVDNKPSVIEINHYSPQLTFILNENLEGSLYELFQNKHNIILTTHHRSLEVCHPTKEEIHLLNLSKNTLLLLFKDYIKDSTGNPMFVSKQLYNTEHMKFYF